MESSIDGVGYILLSIHVLNCLVVGSYRVLSSARIASFSSSNGANSFLSTKSNCIFGRCKPENHPGNNGKYLIHKQEEVSVACIEVSCSDDVC